MMKHLVALFALISVASLAGAQQAEEVQVAGKNAKLFQSAQQSPEMKKLVESFAGRWSTTIHTYKEQWFPREAAVKGRATITAGPAGNSLHENFRSDSPEGNFAGRGAYWWDAEAKAYEGIWCDSMDPRGCGPVGRGTWEEDKLIFHNVIDMGPTKLNIRETFSNITKNGFDFLIEAANGDAPMTKMLSIRYERPGTKSGAGTK
jgi:hypothetical protein